MTDALKFPEFFVLFATWLTCTEIFADPSDDQGPSAEARAAVQDLVDGVESNYDCNFSLDYLIVGLELNTSQYTVVVRLAGNECDEALRVLQLRSMAFPFDFIEFGSFEKPPSQKVPPNKSNKDLIVEENPKDAT